VIDQNSGASHIYNERARQVVQEGYDADHDKGHFIELIDAAIGYAAFTSATLEIEKAVSLGHHSRAEADEFLEKGSKLLPPNWPWGASYWKPSPTDLKRNLIKAGALIAAAIDSLEASGQFADDQDTLFDMDALHADPVPEGLEGAILDPQELLFRALAGDESAQVTLRAAAEQHGVQLAFTPDQLLKEMAARGKEIPLDVRQALENLSEDTLPKLDPSEERLDQFIDSVAKTLTPEWMDWDTLRERTGLLAPDLNDAIDILVSQGIVQRDVNRFRLEG